MKTFACSHVYFMCRMWMCSTSNIWICGFRITLFIPVSYTIWIVSGGNQTTTKYKGFSVIFASYIWYKSCLNQHRSSSDLDSCFVQATIQWMVMGSIEWNCGILTLAQSDPVVSRYCFINSLPKSWDTSWDPICDFKYYSLAKSYSKLLVTKLG